jgi:hypothetical protein
MNLASQEIVELSTTVMIALSVILAVFLTKNYLEKHSKNYLFWSIGLWLFALSVGQEFLFSAGYYSEFMIRSYLVIVAVLVESLALGSIQLIERKQIKNYYYAFSVLSTFALAYFLGTEKIGNILDNYVVYGVLPLGVVVASSLITFPAAIVLIVTAALTYRRTKNNKLLSIIAGVVIVSIAGSLYIAQFPAFLYYSEFIGIALLWLGFFEFRHKRQLAHELAANPSSGLEPRPNLAKALTDRP